MLKKIRLSIYCLLIAANSVSGTPSLKDYGELPRISMIAISPNGEKIAYRKVANGDDVLIVTNIFKEDTPLMLDLKKIEPQQIYFANNSTIFIKASQYQRVEGFRGKFDLSTAFALDLNKNKLNQLLIPGKDNVYPGQIGLGQVVGISTDGKYAFLPGYIGNTDMVLGGSSAPPTFGLMKSILDAKGKHKTVTAGTVHSEDFFIDQEGNLLAEERFNDKIGEHSIWIHKNKTTKVIFQEKTPIRSKQFVGLTSDYNSLVLLGIDNKTNRTNYYLMNLTSGDITNAGFGKENMDIENVIVDINRIVRGIYYSGFSPSYKFFDSVLNKKIDSIINKFSGQSVHIVSHSPDWAHIVVYVEGSQFAGDYFLFSDNKSPVFLTSSRPNIKLEDINPIGKVTFLSRDGLKIPTLITIPKEHVDNMKSLPAVVFPHGGPTYYDKIEFNFFTQALASQGYLVIQPQFRGSTGFGVEFTQAGDKEWGKKSQNDITDSVEYFVKKGYINPDKVCIVGMSYGGYAALAGGAFTPDLYKCVVSINGIGDLYDMYKYDKFEHQNNRELIAILETRFAANESGEVDKEQMRNASPQFFADQFVAPTLLIHSANDDIVPFRQSDNMESALKKARKTVELIKLNGDNHHLQESETRMQALEATVNFVNKHLK